LRHSSQPRLRGFGFFTWSLVWVHFAAIMDTSYQS
jgi:hypothetical protein